MDNQWENECELLEIGNSDPVLQEDTSAARFHCFLRILLILLIPQILGFISKSCGNSQPEKKYMTL